MGGLFRRVVLITLDGVGVGALPDAAVYGDEGANTLLHVAQACGGLHLPHLQRFGLGNILPLPGVEPVVEPLASFGRMAERSAGKDTTTGHWELSGVIQSEPLPTYPTGFPAAIIDAFGRETGLGVLGNCAASGTEILRQLGEEHLRTGWPIVYTSADSVFQIAAHEDIISVEKLYQICETARRILNPYRIGRVIARPFLGDCAQTFSRTCRRHDFSLAPTGPTVLDTLSEQGQRVFGVGKIRDIFTGRGITDFVYSQSNADGMEKTLTGFETTDKGLVFTNLVDFDMVFGHRLDALGFGGALREFDAWMPRMMERMDRRDLLILTADHGCDPTTPGTDHSREYVPVMLWHPGMAEGRNLGVRESFADVAATVARALGVHFPRGSSML